MSSRRFISSDLYDAIELVNKVIDALPDDPTAAEDRYQLFKIFQARDCLRMAYDYERDQEAILMEGFY